MDEGIGAFDHLQERRARRLVLEVEAKRALVAVHVEIGRAHARRLARLADVAHRVALRRLDLDDVGALVGQQHGAVGPEDDVGEVDDPDAFERAGHCPVLCRERPRDCHRLDSASPPLALRRKTREEASMDGRTPMRSAACCTARRGGRDRRAIAAPARPWLRKDTQPRSRSVRDELPDLEHVLVRDSEYESWLARQSAVGRRFYLIRHRAGRFVSASRADQPASMFIVRDDPERH